MLRVVILAFLATAIAAQNMFRPCNPNSANYGPPPRTNTIDDCSEWPCTFIRGGIGGGYTEFVNPVFTVNLTANVAFQTGSAIGVYPLPVDQVYACNNLIGNSCPLDPNEDVTYRLAMPVSYEYPPETSLILEISLRNQFYQVVMCYEGDFIVV